MAEKKSTKGKAKSTRKPAKPATQGKKSARRKSTNRQKTGANKPQVISVKLEPQIIEIKQEKEKKEANSILTILGESSLILAVVTAFLFMVGWAYESNWYTYFGISTEKVNISVPQVLIRSIPIIFIALIIVLVSYIILSLIYLILIYIFFKQNLSLQRLSEEKWSFVFGLSLIFTYISSFFVFPFRISGNYLDLVSQLSFEGFSVVPIGLVLFVTAILVIPFLIHPATRLIILYSFSTKTNRMILMAIFGFFYLFAILSMSSSLAFYDASARRKGLSETGNLQEVLLISPKSLSFIKNLEISCDLNDACIYGPFDLLEETDNSFILIQNDRLALNPQKPEIYIFPRSDDEKAYYIIPASISSPIPTATFTPQPIFTVTPKLIIATPTLIQP